LVLVHGLKDLLPGSDGAVVTLASDLNVAKMILPGAEALAHAKL
jgi:hypothetical protein